MNKYEGLNGHFIGHLENEPDACVAMVKHPEHSELTIMSNRNMGLGSSSMFKWNQNGMVELIPEIFSNNQKDILLSDELVGDQDTQNQLNEIEHTMTDEQVKSVPVTAKLQVKVHRNSFDNLSEIYSVSYK